MKLKPFNVATLFLLFILILVVPSLSSGRLYAQEVDPGIYEIDYRGPETHSYLPPPDRSKVKKPKFPGDEHVMADSRSKGLGDSDSTTRLSVKKHQG